MFDKVIKAIEGGMGIAEAIEYIYGSLDEKQESEIYESFIAEYPEYLNNI